MSLRDKFAKAPPRKRRRIYTVYATGPNGSLSTRSVDYDRGTHKWALTVKAASIKAAYWLIGHQQVSVRNGDGIIAIERHDNGARSTDWGWNDDVEALIPKWLKGSAETAHVSRFKFISAEDLMNGVR